MSKWENDLSCPDISLLPELARILGVTVDELLSGKSAGIQPAVQLLPEESRKDIRNMMLRIVVDSADGDRVRVNLPMGLVQVALEMGMDMPEISGSDALKNIDLGRILDMVKQGAVGNLVEVDSADGDTVRIFVE